MCKECGFFKCHPRCPNAPEPPIFDHCEECGCEIYDGDEYYEIDGKRYCEACIYSFLKIAEVDDE